jgi:hypothetical protein
MSPSPPKSAQSHLRINHRADGPFLAQVEAASDPMSFAMTNPRRSAAATSVLVVVTLVAAVLGANVIAAGAAKAPAVHLWGAAAAPANVTSSDTRSVELGVRFYSDQAGRIKGVRFYKGAGNTGVHTGSLWSNDGTLLARATFRNESSSGWQSATFSSPVDIAAGTAYVVSYHAPVGGFSYDRDFFKSAPPTNAPLHAWVDGAYGLANGVYRYGKQPIFPTNTRRSMNYWVDVTFVPATQSTTTTTQSTTTTTSQPTTTTTQPTTTTTQATTTTTMPPTTTTTVQQPPPGLAVRVAGNRLVDGSGTTLRLRGADASATEFVCAQNWSDDAYGGQPFGQLSSFQAMRTWHINVVRIPLNEDCWLNINGVRIGGANYQSQIRNEVSLAHQAGLYVILDLHWNAPGSVRALSQQPAPDADHSPTFWQQVATAYKSDPGVIFDLYNEPFDYWGTKADPWDGWLNGDTQTQYMTGGSPYTVTMNWQTAGVQQLINVVRATGATNPVLVNGMDWSNDVSGWLSHEPKDPAAQLIVGSHVYPGQPCSNTSCWDRVYPALAAKYPILVGETGDSVNAPANFLPGFLSYAESHGWNYLAWTWNVWGDSANVLITSWSGTPNSGEGTTFRNFLLAH